MTTNAIAVVNGQPIQVSNDEQQLVPIKPICDALGIDRKRQQDKIKDHPILSSVWGLTPLTGADGKTYEMLCLPLEFIFGWLFTINPNNVDEGAKEALIRYQLECYHALYEHFTKAQKKERELLEAENKCLKDLDEARKLLAESKDAVAAAKKRISDIEAKLLAIRDERHSPQQTLF